MRLKHPVERHDEVSYFGVVYSSLSRRTPCALGAEIVIIDTDEFYFVRCSEPVRSRIKKASAQHKMHFAYHLWSASVEYKVAGPMADRSCFNA